MPRRIIRKVRNHGSRGGVRPRLIVLHTTESHNRKGVSDLESLANWFNNQRSRASSHVGVDAEGNDVVMVSAHRSAWTQVSYNRVSLSIEQIGFAATKKKVWLRDNHRQLHQTAKWVAHWSLRHKIPIRKSTRHGVCQHNDLGRDGGGHWDCGPGYPVRYVMRWAKLERVRKLGNKYGWTKKRKAEAAYHKRMLKNAQRIHKVKHTV